MSKPLEAVIAEEINRRWGIAGLLVGIVVLSSLLVGFVIGFVRLVYTVGACG